MFLGIFLGKLHLLHLHDTFIQSDLQMTTKQSVKLSVGQQT